jgi:hypothetical protein
MSAIKVNYNELGTCKSRHTCAWDAILGNNQLSRPQLSVTLAFGASWRRAWERIKGQHVLDNSS